MKKILTFVVLSAILCACSYDKLPPKTDDASSTYVLPKGELPTEAERNIALQAKAEYEEWLELTN